MRRNSWLQRELAIACERVRGRNSNEAAAAEYGLELSAEEIVRFVGGFHAGEVADYQMTAFCMAVFLRGMSHDETAAMTLAMANSGDRDLEPLAQHLASDASELVAETARWALARFSKTDDVVDDGAGEANLSSSSVT